MKKQVLVLTASTFVLIFGSITASAQQGAGTPVTAQPDQTQQQPVNRGGSVQEGTFGQGGMMGRMMGRGMMGQGGTMARGRMGQAGLMGPFVMRVIFAMMDSDGDGTVSLQEFQAAHERIFKAMDANKDGVFTLEEMQAFIQGTRRAVPQQ